MPIKEEKKTRERFQKIGSTHYEEDKRKLMARSRRGLFLTMDSITTQLEAGKPLRDEQIRFMKNFSSTLATLETREDALGPKEVGLPEGRLKEFVERQFKFIEATGYTDTRGDGLSVMKKSQYTLCLFCGEFHKAPDFCPFEKIAKERKLHGVVGGKEERLKDSNGAIDLTRSD